MHDLYFYFILSCLKLKACIQVGRAGRMLVSEPTAAESVARWPAQSLPTFLLPVYSTREYGNRARALKPWRMSWVWWFTSVVSAILEAEIGGLLELGRLQTVWETHQDSALTTERQQTILPPPRDRRKWRMDIRSAWVWTAEYKEWWQKRLKKNYLQEKFEVDYLSTCLSVCLSIYLFIWEGSHEDQTSLECANIEGSGFENPVLLLPPLVLGFQVCATRVGWLNMQHIIRSPRRSKEARIDIFM